MYSLQLENLQNPKCFLVSFGVIDFDIDECIDTFLLNKIFRILHSF